METMIDMEFKAHKEVFEATYKNLTKEIANAASLLIVALQKGNKLLICGNGGSAADAQHIAAEIIGRYKADRVGLPAIALSTDTSALTAIGNDFGFEYIFSRQVEALANPGDVLLAISTSGTSGNILKAIQEAHKKGCKCIGLSGKDGGKMREIVDINLIVPGLDTPRIQEMHILIGHILCQAIDDATKEI